MIEVTLQPNPFEPYRRERILVPTDEPVDLAEILPAGWDLDDPTVRVLVDGDEAESDMVEPGSHVAIFRTPGLHLVVTWPAIYQILFVVGTMAASAVIQKALAPKADEPVTEDNETESFRGFTNSYFPGGSIPIVFGIRRFAPPVVGQVIENSFGFFQLGGAETMKLLLCLGHGPIEGLGSLTGKASTAAELSAIKTGNPIGVDDNEAIGLKINGQNASNFADVFAYWRTGELEQDPFTALGGFPDSSTDVSIAQDVKEYSAAIDITEVTGFAAGVYSSGSDIDSASGESLSHTMVDEADRFAISLFFPNGIFKDAGGGATSSSTCSFRIQYWPVDSGGTRTGDTLILPEWFVTGDSITPQTIQYEDVFYSPTSYVGASQLGYIRANNANTLHAKVTAPVASQNFPPLYQSSSLLKFSTHGWIRCASGGAFDTRWTAFSTRKGSCQLAPLTSNLPLGTPYGASDSTSHSGMSFGVAGANSSTPRLFIACWVGWAVRVYESPAIAATGVTGQWLDIGFTWDGTAGASGVLTFYHNGTPLAATATTYHHSTGSPGGGTPAFWTEGDLVIGYPGSAASGSGGGAQTDVSDLAIYNGVKDAAWFVSRSTTFDKAGHPASVLSSGDPDLTFGSHLSENVAAGQIENLAFPASTTTGEVIDEVGASLQDAPKTDAPLWEVESGLPVRGRYHVELYRVDAVDDDPSVEINISEWKALTLTTDEDFSHPGVAKLAVSIDGDDQIGNSRPDISVIVRGAKVPIWNGISAEYPTFDAAWTRNPAWIALYLLTEEEVGLGGIWDRRTDVDLTSWKAWANYCDEGVEDGNGTQTFFDGDPVAISADHPYGEVHFKIGIIDASGASTGYKVPDNWTVGYTLRIKTASDSAWQAAAADDSVRLTITSISYDDDDTAANGYQHWAQIECDWTPDYTLPSAINVTGTVVGFEARHECDLILDSKTDDGWDTILQVMRTARAAPIIIGDKMSVWVDRARDPDFLITQAQMVDGSYSKSWESNADRYNGVEFEFVDRDLDYEIQPWIEHHPSVSGETDPRRIRVASPQLLRGVTRTSEVRRHSVFRLNQMHLLRERHSFQLGPDGLGIAPGDRLRISHDVAEVSESGRIFADVSTLTEVKLDRDVVVTNGSTYQIEVRSSGQVTADGKEKRQTVTLHASMIPGSGSSTLAAGSTITLASPGFDEIDVKQGDVYAFGETSATAEDATVVRVTLDAATMLRKVDCIEYNANVYLDNEWGDLPADPGADLPPDPSNNGVGGGIKRIGDPQGDIGGTVPAAKERTHSAVDGKPTSAVIVTWPSTTKSIGGTNVYWASTTDGSRPQPKLAAHVPSSAVSAEIDGRLFRQGQGLRFYIQHLAASGAGRRPVNCPSCDLTYGGRTLPPAAPTVTTPKSRNQQAAYRVTFPEGRVPEGVEVRVGGWILGQKVAHALRDGDLVGEWVFGADNAAADGAYTHYVRSLLPSGQVSEAATFVNFDDEPLGMAEVDATAHEDAWGSGTLSGLVASSGELVFTGSGTEGTFTSPEVDMTVAKRYFVEVACEAEQVHPETWGVDEPWEDRREAGALWEGPTGGEDAQLSRLEIEWTPSTTGTPSVNWTSVRPGVEHFRSAKFRIRVTRPDDTFDVRIKRFGVRVLSVADYEPGDIDGGQV